VYDSDNNKEHLHKPPQTKSKFEFILAKYIQTGVWVFCSKTDIIIFKNSTHSELWHYLHQHTAMD